MPTNEPKRKAPDILTWPVCLGPKGEEIKVFEVSFSQLNLRKALTAIYAESYGRSGDGKRFLDQVIPKLRQWFREEKEFDPTPDMVRTALLRCHTTKVFEKIVYRLEEKIINRLLSIVSSGQIAAERHINRRLTLPQQKLASVKREIFFNYPELERDVLGIQAGRPAESKEQLMQRIRAAAEKLLSSGQNLSKPQLAKAMNIDLRWLQRLMKRHVENWPKLKAELKRKRAVQE